MKISVDNRSGRKGFRADPAAFINQVKTNLAGYQSGFPVVRELIQNADDSGATRIKLILVPPLCNAQHPLFRAPGLMVVNDGNFREEDSVGIRSLGLGTKGANKETIGKFGLGLKSVFHLCEVFCFGASATEKINAGPFCDILNPWSGVKHKLLGSVFNSWDDLTGPDQQILTQLAADFATGWMRWFFVYLPLRQRRLCPLESGGEAVAIANNFAGDNLEQELAIWWHPLCREISSSLPLLRHLTEIIQAQRDSLDDPERVTARLELEPTSRRSQFPLNLRRGNQNFFVGHICHRDGTEGLHHFGFGGLETYPNATVLEELQRNEHWPRQPTLFHEEESSLQKEEKNAPHLAVYFVSRPPDPPGSGHFRLLLATFLPVGEPKEKTPIELDLDIDLVLHGFFFVDPSRSRILLRKPESESSKIINEENLQESWNWGLFDRILAIIPQALALFAQHRQSNHLELSCLTRAIHDSKFWREYCSLIEATWVWECRLIPANSGDKAPRDQDSRLGFDVYQNGLASHWVLVDRQTLQKAPPILLPVPEGRELADVFPRVPLLAASRPLLRPKEQRIARVQARHCLDIVELELLLDSPEKFFLSIDRHANVELLARLQCLEKLLQQATEQPASVPWIQNWALAFVRAAVVRLTQARFHEVRSGLVDLLNLTREEDRLYLNSDGPGAYRYYQIWAREQSIRRCVLPGDSATGALKCRPLDHHEVGQFLACLAGADNSIIAWSLTELLVKPFLEELPKVWELHAQLELFPVHNVQSGERQRRSYADLKAYRDQDCLFLQKDIQWQFERCLLQALPDHQLFILQEDVARLIFGEGSSLQGCNSQVAARWLELRPRLAPQESRSQLFFQMSQSHWSPEFFKACRYLLHGRAKAYDLMDTLWILKPAQSPASWGGVMRTLMADGGDDWRVIQGEWLERLDPQLRGRLNVHEPDSETVVDYLKYGKSLENLSGPQRQFLFVHVHDDELLRTLPIHQRTDGVYCQLDHTTFLEDSTQLPEAIQRELHLIAPYKDPTLRQKQERLVAKLRPVDGLRAALITEQPSEHWQFILDCIAQGHGSALSSHILSRPWLLLKSGQPLSPENFIHLENLEEPLSSFLTQAESSYRGLADLATEIRLEPGWCKVEATLFSNPNCSTRLLADVLSGQPALGNLSDDWANQSESLSCLLELPTALLACGPLLRALYQQRPKEVPPLLSKLFRPCSLERALELYRCCVEKSKERKRFRFSDLSLEFLREASRHTQFKEIWNELPMLSQAGSWSSSGQLCSSHPMVQPASQLHIKVEKILQPWLPQPEIQNTARESAVKVSTRKRFTVAQCIKYLFQLPGWSECPEEVIGAFYAAFTPIEPSLQNEARRLLRSDLESIQEGLKIPNPPTVAVHKFRGIQPKDLTLKLEIDIIESNSISAPNLLGNVQDFLLCAEPPSHLLVNSELDCSVQGPDSVTWKLQFRAYPAKALDEASLSDIVWNTFCQVLRRCYYLGRPEIWDELKSQVRHFWEERILRAGQFELIVAQRMVEIQIPFYIPTLSGKRSKRLQKEHTHWRDLKRQLAEAKANKVINDRQPPLLLKRVAELESSIHDIEREMVRLVREDSDVQLELLEMVRAKIGEHYQYQANSIAFELLQNADDASIEAEEMQDNQNANSFLVWEGSGFLQFGHNGRAINRSRSYFGKDFRNRGYHRDLEKMLLLQHSDKESSVDLNLTGKFGLGFKSVFLASDTVQVESGNRRFRIVGGLYPVPTGRVPAPDGYSFDTRITIFPKKGTSKTESWKEEILADFMEKIPVQLVFLRKIRVFQWIRDGGQVTLQWEPHVVKDVPELEIGQLSCTDKLPKQALVVRTQFGTVLMGLDRNGPKPYVRPDFPHCWVTTPLSECLHCGFLFSAPFQVNIARRRLTPGSLINRESAEELGKACGQALATLHRQIQVLGWETMREELRLESTTECQTFWCQLWHTMSRTLAREQAEEEGEILAELIEKACLLHLEAILEAIPTGLWQSFAGTTRRHHLKAKVDGYLAQSARFKKALPLLERCYNRQELIHPENYQVACRLFDGFQLQTLKLRDLLEQCSPDRRLGSLEAELLRELIPDVAWRADNTGLSGEVVEIGDWLRHCKLRNQTDKWSALQDLLIEGVDEDEDKLLEFCPSCHQLHKDYPIKVRSALYRLRGAHRFSAVDMAQWISGASQREDRESGLAYLVRGGNGREIASSFHRLVIAQQVNWLDQTYMRNIPLEESEKTELQRLILPRATSPESPLDSIPYRMPSARAAQRYLKKLAAWWETNRNEALQRYTRNLYPGQRVPIWKGNLTQTSEDWFILLALGAFQTMGRQTEHQHRAFLELLQRRKWMAKLLEVSQRPETFTEVLENYFEEEDEQVFLHWLRQMPILFQLARWLEEYQSMLLEFNKEASDQRLRDFLKPRSTPYYQGSGFRAPNLTRSLGVGVHFILRELRRHKTLTAKRIDPYCFAVSERVSLRWEKLFGRKLPQEPEAASLEMHQYLNSFKLAEAEALLPDYDLPWRLITEEQWEAIL